MKNLRVWIFCLLFTLIFPLEFSMCTENCLTALSWEWNTYLGSWHGDEGTGIVTDGNGNIYVTGLSKAAWGTPINAYTGDDDAFIAKLNNNGELQWHTFLGGVSEDVPHGIGLDSNGNVYVAGISSAAWGSPVNAYTANDEVFVAKVNDQGVLQWNTFLGGSDRDYGYGIAVDETGNVFVAGSSESGWGVPVSAYSGDFDLLVAKLNSSGELQWHTFIGGADTDMGRGIALDGSGQIYVAGYSYNTWGSPLNAFAGYFDALIVKLNNSGTKQWHTFLGGTSWDYGMSIAVNGNDQIYVAGNGNATWGSPVNPYTDDDEVYVAELNSSGALQWNTFMGSLSEDNGVCIGTDSGGHVYVTGYSDTTWGSPVNPYAGYYDVFAAVLNSSGIRQGHTFMGGPTLDTGGSLAIDSNNNLYVTGRSGTTWGSPVNAHAGLSDAFVVKFNYSNIVRVEKDSESPEGFRLSQNFPNPFNPSTTIRFDLPQPGDVTLKVFSLLGEEVQTLISKRLPAGEHQVLWNAGNQPGGIYLVRLETGGFIRTRKMIVMK